MSPPPPGGSATVLFGVPRLPPGTLLPALLGEPTIRFHRVPRSSERARGATHTALFGGPRATPTRGQATVALRSFASRASLEPRRQHSSEGREQRFTGAGNVRSLGARSPELFGAPHAEPR
jgi:hypothetical protein